MRNPVCELLRCELPIQLAPMGSVAATPALPLAVAMAGGHGMYPALGLPAAFWCMTHRSRTVFRVRTAEPRCAAVAVEAGSAPSRPVGRPYMNSSPQCVQVPKPITAKLYHLP